MTTYIVRWSDGRLLSTHSSYAGARHEVALLAGKVYIAKGGGVWWGYSTRAHMHADRHGNAPHLVLLTIRPESEEEV